MVNLVHLIPFCVLIRIALCQTNVVATNDSNCAQPLCSCCLESAHCEDYGGCHGLCKDGYFGSRCLNICPDKCILCTDPYNPTGDESLFGVANCTRCKDGYYSTSEFFQCQLECLTTCQTCTSATECTSCINGHFLEDGTCPRCRSGCASCASYDNCTQCQDKYYLDETICNKCKHGCAFCTGFDVCTQCLDGFYDLGNIFNDLNCVACSDGCSNMCNKASGTCSCIPGYTGTKCDRCVDGRYGAGCIGTCRATCATCISMFSCTSCVDGYYLLDHICQRCPEHCLHGTCDETTGACMDGCINGYSGDKCCLNGSECRSCSSASQCSECSMGKFGDTCDNDCPENCAGTLCDKDDGTCDKCINGYDGDDCTILLPVPDNNKGNVGVAIGGGVTGAVVIIALVIVAILFYKRRLGSCGRQCGSCEQSNENTEGILSTPQDKIRKLHQYQQKETMYAQKIAQIQLELNETTDQPTHRNIKEDKNSVTESPSYESLEQRQTGDYTYVE